MAQTHLMKDPNTNANLTNDLSLNSAFLLHNGFDNNSITTGFQISDIEMIKLQPATYTSLKDLLPASPPSIISPSYNSSWSEIPIKNPLVKHAALAYLQPMSSPPEAGDKGLLGKLRDSFCCQCECFSWINDVVFRSVKEVFWDGHIEEEDEDDEKVE